MQIATPSRYGALQDGFAFELGDGYVVLVGENNSGKSAVLQLVFKTLIRHPDFGTERLCLLLEDRAYVQQSNETGGQNLANFNTQLLTYLDGAPLQHASPAPFDWSTLPRLLLNHTNLKKQMLSLDKLLARMGLPEHVLKASQNIYFEDVSVAAQGSGLRSLLSILSALTDERISAVLIDEPELSLQPGLQKTLRDVLIESSRIKRILVATHSHLFLQRAAPSANLRVKREGAVVSLSPMAAEDQLYDLTFELLGNSTEDLFFPGNFLIVEGASDQVIVERVRNLLNINASKVRVVSASGLANVPPTLEAVSRMLTPVVMKDSPYARKVVAMIDQSGDPPPPAVAELRKVLDSRFFELDQPSMEAYIPEGIYARSGRNKAKDLQTIAKLRSNYQELNSFKRTLSQQIAGQLSGEDLEVLPIIAAAVRKASE